MKHNPGRPVWVIDSHVWGFSNAKSELSRQQLFSLFFCDSGQMNCRNTSNLPRMCACKQRLAGGHWCGKSCASLNFSCRMHLFAKTLCITWHRDGCCVNAHLLPIAMHKGSCISSCTAFACLTTVLESSKTNWGRERVYHFSQFGYIRILGGGWDGWNRNRFFGDLVQRLGPVNTSTTPCLHLRTRYNFWISPPNTLGMLAVHLNM